LKLARARTKIGKAHCSVGTITRKHASASRRGKVIAQSPKPGRRLKNHAKVNLTVGK
jgi:beta-lactam-binding protein with PASTA domain